MMIHKRLLHKSPAIKLNILVLVFLTCLATIHMVHASKDIKVWTYKNEIYSGRINLIYVKNIGTENVDIIWVYVSGPPGGHWYKEQNFVLKPEETKICCYPHDFPFASTEETGLYEVEVWWEHGTKTTSFSVVNQTATDGGITFPVDKFGLLTPYIGLASTIVAATAATAVCVKRVKRRKER